MDKVKLLIVDDSAVIRNILKTNLAKYSDIEIVGVAREPFEARDMIVKLKPDVITLDIEMPKMTGLEFTAILMKHHPLPIIIVSSLVKGNCETSFKALELGAVDIFPKPSANVSQDFPLMMNQLYEKIIAASKAKVFKRDNSIKKVSLAQVKATDKIIAVGASTGGTQAIQRVLEALPAGLPPIIITQHMPAGFTKSFADRLNTICANLEVREAQQQENLYNGLVLIAPGGYHLILNRDGAKFKTIVKYGPKVCRQRPAVDVMFKSVAEHAGKNSVGVLLTGMGEDGAEGLLQMKNSGARTISQNEKSCVVYGMPRAAELKGASEFVEDLDDIPQKIIDLI